MRLNEILSDKESEVYDHLRRFLCILRIASKIPALSTELEQLINRYKQQLYEDESNLSYFIMYSERIADLYNEVIPYLYNT